MHNNDGKIQTCATTGCGHICCQFHAGNYILLFPGELESAQTAGQSTAHLDIESDGRGGHKVICRAKNAANCDGGFKPLDCVSYPFWPADKELTTVIKGEKCPLQSKDLSAHGIKLLELWHEAIRRDPRVGEWLNGAQMVGYTKPFPIPVKTVALSAA